MIWVNILAVLALFFSFIGGLKEGAVKNFFSLIALIIAIPIAGLSHRHWLLSSHFCPGRIGKTLLGSLLR